MAPFFVIPFKSSCVGSDMSILSDMRADLEASTALASPLKFPGCGGFFSSVASTKLPELGGSYSFIVAGFWSLSSFIGLARVCWMSSRRRTMEDIRWKDVPGRFGGRGEEGEEPKCSGVAR
uniref:Uncharacterized protein n=1 Tax=Brassica oleracea TaxID=3712 RepID=A0A3P6C523_BRAOL|nr:unnamed protein product [Brassica oleracea]